MHISSITFFGIINGVKRAPMHRGSFHPYYLIILLLKTLLFFGEGVNG